MDPTTSTSSAGQTTPNQDPSAPETNPATPPPTNKKYTQVKEQKPMAKNPNKPVPTLALALVIVLAGIGTGYGLFRLKGPTSATPQQSSAPTQPDEVIEGQTYGSQVNGFSDEGSGVIISGGFEGEGTHRLLRPGGESQTICLTSSVLDLDLFVDHQVQLWGETFDTQKCGWFMDVGRVEVEKLNAEKPFAVNEEE